MLFSSDFYNAIDNQTLPKYASDNAGSLELPKTNCKCIIT